MTSNDVINAFVDNEPVAAAALGAALAEPAGRELLLDLLALRALVADEADAAPIERRADAGARSRWIATGFLAASLIFGAGAAWLLPPLLRQQPADAPPRPDRVVIFETATNGPR